MAGRYTAYPEYKDSDVGLLGDIPSHWAVDKFRYLFSLGRGLGITKANLQDSGIPCVNYGEIHSKYGFEISPDTHPLKCVSELYLELSPNSLLANGDCIFADTSEDLEGAGNFTQLTSDKALFAGYHTIITRPKGENDARFLAYILDSPTYRTQIQLAVKGVKVFSITQEILKNTDLWLPSIPEQKQIAKFLDHETGKIDLLISKQQALVALLKEKRQAVISHAVTKGLNPNVKIKDSGVEWLGEVPEHWEVVQSRRLFALRNEPARKSDQQLTASQKYGMIFQSDFMELEGRRVVQIVKGTDSLKHAEPNDFIISLRSFQGGLEWCKFAGAITFHYVVLIPINGVHEPFFAHLFKSDAFIQALRSTTNLIRDGQDLRYSHFILLDLPVIPIPEQKQIAKYLHFETTRFDELMVKAEEQVQLLKERRTALISAAVTGKIDVRDWEPAPGAEK